MSCPTYLESDVIILHYRREKNAGIVTAIVLEIGTVTVIATANEATVNKETAAAARDLPRIDPRVVSMKLIPILRAVAIESGNVKTNMLLATEEMIAPGNATGVHEGRGEKMTIDAGEGTATSSMTGDEDIGNKGERGREAVPPLPQRRRNQLQTLRT